MHRPSANRHEENHIICCDFMNFRKCKLYCIRRTTMPKGPLLRRGTRNFMQRTGETGIARRAFKSAAPVLMSAVLAFPNPAQAACKPTPDQASIGVRALQTELMVAGLKCSAEQWNSFTRQFRTTIKSNADRLQSLFHRTYGKAGPNRMNAFVTQLANDASQRSNGAAEADYCREQDELFRKVLALTAAELEQFSASRQVAVATPVALCVPDTGASAATTLAAEQVTTPVKKRR